jgi:hypothetical protein
MRGKLEVAFDSTQEINSMITIVCLLDENRSISENVLLCYYGFSSLSATSGEIKPILWAITNTTATAEATSNKENTLSCPSPCRNVLNPNGLIAKIIKPTKIEDSIAISFNNLCSSREAELADEESLSVIIRTLY